jgi:hypothetical protein
MTEFFRGFPRSLQENARIFAQIRPRPLPSTFFPIHHAPGAHPASCIMGTWCPFPRAKALTERDADHSPPYSAEVVNDY